MPTEFQRIMDELLEGLSNTYTFIDDVLIVRNVIKKTIRRKYEKFWRDQVA